MDKFFEKKGEKREEKGSAAVGNQIPDADVGNLACQIPDTDEQLLERFFLSARQEAMADDGFTERVIGHIEAETMMLAKRSQRLSWLWTSFCVLLALGIFSWLGGWSHLATVIVGFLYRVPTLGQLVQLMLCGAFVTMLAVAEVLRREHITIRSLRV